jgi:glucose/mannose transport system substrate-binding protein
MIDLSGCQTSGSDEGPADTVTPASVPGSTVALRHGAEDGPTGAALDQLRRAFEAEHGVEVVDAPDAGVTNEQDEESSEETVTYGRIGAALAERAQSLRDLSDLWEGNHESYPYGLVVSSFIERSFVVVPQTAHRLNCLYFNPSVLSEVGVTPEDYATVSDLQRAPGPLAGAVETLFAQPLRSATDLLELWEGLLGSRLYRERQYVQYVAGDLDDEPLPIVRATRDLDAALSMLPADAAETTPASLLDAVVEGSVGFVRQPTWAGQHLIERDEATYGTDWAVSPLFASPWTLTVVAEGFAVPSTSARAATPRELIRFATTAERQREFCATAVAIPARTDVTVDAHPMLTEQATAYREASMHLPSMAHGIAVRTPVRRRLEDALSAFRTHRDTDRAVTEIVAALRTAEVL